MVQYLAQSVEAAKKQLSEISRVDQQQNFTLKEAFKTSEHETFTKLNESLNILSLTSAAQVGNVELKVSGHESQFSISHAKVTAVETAQIQAMSKVPTLEQAQARFHARVPIEHSSSGTVPPAHKPSGR